MYRVINGKLQKVTQFAEPAEVQVDALLSGISIGYRIEGFIANLILPRVRVPRETFQYPVFSRDNVQKPGNPIKRADKAPYARAGWTVTMSEKTAIEYGIEVPVSDRERRNAESVINPDMHANNVANDLVANQVEADACTLLTNTAVLTATETLTGGDQWSDYTNSDPLLYIQGKAETILKAVHRPPNTLVLGFEVYNRLTTHPALRRKLDASIVGRAEMATAFNVDRVIVSMATYDSQNPGQSTQVGAFMWGKHALLCYVGTGPEIETPALGYQFEYQPRQTSRYREEEITSDIVRVAEMSLAGITNAASGYLIKNAVA